MDKYAIYARFSSEGQNEKSAEAQIYECTEYIKKKGGTITATYEDERISGASAFRDDYQFLLRDIPRGKFNILIAEGLDRLSRNQGDIAKLYEFLSYYNIKLVTLSEGENIDEMVIAFQGLNNSKFLKDLSLKTKRGLRARVREGKNPGSRPYGYRPSNELDPATRKVITGKLIKVDEEIEVIHRIYIEFAEGQSPGKIARRLNADNIPAPNKKSDRWSDSAVRQILRNETYIGRRFFNRNSYIKNPATGKYVEHRNPESEWLVNEDEALRIMGENLWNSVQARWKEINSKACHICIKNALTGKRRKNYMLSGLIFCSECGGTYTLGSKNRYNCGNYKRDNCKNGNSIRRQIVENHVLDLLLNKMLKPERVDKFLKSYQHSLEEAKGKLDKDNAGIRRKLKKIDKEIDAFMDAIAQGIVTKSTRTRLLELEERKQEFEKNLKPTPELSVRDDKLVDQYRGLLEDMSGALDDDSVRYKAMNIIRPLIAKIILYPVDQGLRAEIYGQIENLLYMHIDKDGNFFYIPESDIEQLTIVRPSISDSFVFVVEFPYWQHQKHV